MAEIALSCAQMLGWLYSQFWEMLDAMGFFGLYITFVTFFLVYKFIFAPVFGHAKSDLAHQTYRSSKRRKDD